jgi:two-component system, NtrC family, sensor kinase
VARVMGILKGGATFAWTPQMPVTASKSTSSSRDARDRPSAEAAHDRLSDAETPRRDVSQPRRSAEGAKLGRSAGSAKAGRTLGTRLALSVALSVATVISLVAMVGAFIAGQQLDTDLRETARVTAVALADEIELRTDTPSRDDLLPLLRNFMDAAGAIDLNAISVFDAATDPQLVARTSELATVPGSIVRRAISTREPVWSIPEHSIVTVAVPITRGDAVSGAVAVSVSLRSISQLRRTAGLVALVGVLLAIGGITLLIHLRARQLILEPLATIRRVMAQARGGDLSARAQVPHDDELREVATGLNAMLAELEDLQRTLTDRVASKTEELRERNEQLVRSYESLLQLRETAARAQELAAVGQTMANVAHQIGTPLNLASGHVQLLQREMSDDPALQRRLTIVQEQIERVATAVRDLLQRARPRPDARRVDVAAMLERLVDASRIRLAAARVTLAASVPSELPAVTADETQLELAVLNLITNALDAMPDGGTLTLAASSSDSTVRIEVTDTGTGIPPDILPHIFQPWVTTKSVGQGTGLGLSITRDVVNRLGGTVTASSQPGQGSTFVITLPATPVEHAGDLDHLRQGYGGPPELHAKSTFALRAPADRAEGPPLRSGEPRDR